MTCGFGVTVFISSKMTKAELAHNFFISISLQAASGLVSIHFWKLDSMPLKLLTFHCYIAWKKKTLLYYKEHTKKNLDETTNWFGGLLETNERLP